MAALPTRHRQSAWFFIRVQVINNGNGTFVSVRNDDDATSAFAVLKNGDNGSQNSVVRFTSDGNATFSGTVTQGPSDVKFKAQTRSVPTSQLEDIKNLQFRMDLTEDAPGNQERNDRRNRGLVPKAELLILNLSTKLL